MIDIFEQIAKHGKTDNFEWSFNSCSHSGHTDFKLYTKNKELICYIEFDI